MSIKDQILLGFWNSVTGLVSRAYVAVKGIFIPTTKAIAPRYADPKLFHPDIAKLDRAAKGLAANPTKDNARLFLKRNDYLLQKRSVVRAEKAKLDAISPKKTQDFVNISNADQQLMILDEAIVHNKQAQAKALEILQKQPKFKKG